MDTPSRKISNPPPVKLLVGSILLGVAILGTIFFAVFYTGQNIVNARMPGIITEKTYTPSAPERQITIGDAGLVAQDKDGEYVLMVEVSLPDGTKRNFKVWVDKTRYEALKVGDSFDVGPYVVE